MTESQQKNTAERISGKLADLLGLILDKGIAINGQIRIDKLTLTSAEKGGEIGLLPAQGEQKQDTASRQGDLQQINIRLQRLREDVDRLNSELQRLQVQEQLPKYAYEGRVAGQIEG